MSQSFTRRLFLRASLLLGAAFGISRAGLARMQEETATPEATPPTEIDVTGAIHQVHDPSIIKAEDTYYVFCTGDGIPVRQSADLVDWSISFPASVFSVTPDWAQKAIPGATNIWAPDISFYNGKYQLYYAVSTFGSNRSVIGLATNTMFASKAAGFNWVDEGLVVESHQGDNYNCIDPNFVLDADGAAWLVFGSFWSGIKMRRLDPATGKLSGDDPKLYALAQRFENSGAIEAPFIISRENFYYLFVSFDFCCQGASSTYNIRVGRSEKVTGPYADRDGVTMLLGGGTEIVFPTDRWIAPGHNGILQENGVDYIVYHALDADRQDVPTLRIDPLIWDADGWPSVPALT